MITDIKNAYNQYKHIESLYITANGRGNLLGNEFKRIGIVLGWAAWQLAAKTPSPAVAKRASKAKKSPAAA